MTGVEPVSTAKRNVAPEPFEVTLRDGTRALLRPIRPEDKTRLQEGVRRLSPESRYRRFHAALDRLTDAQLADLTEIDYEDHMAWVAVTLEPDGRGMGVARYIRLAEDPTIAEVAVTVADEYQGRGLGSLLLLVLSRSAIEHGIRTFRNYVLADNVAMLAALSDLGATSTLDEGYGVHRVDMPLPDDPESLPDTSAMRVLHASAARRLPPFCQLLGRLRARAREAGAWGEELVAEVEQQLRAPR
jgi:GNAT superfamily N-acetyltransferase